MTSKQQRISLKKGLRKYLPEKAPVGEPLWCSDTGEIFVGTGDSILPVSNGGIFFDKQLVSDIELTDEGEIFRLLDEKANVQHKHKKSDIIGLFEDGLGGSDHHHSNFTTLEEITPTKVRLWDNKSDFSGSYFDLRNKPTIPTALSQLHNDRNFASEDYVNRTVDSKITNGQVNLSNYYTKRDSDDRYIQKTEGVTRQLLEGNYYNRIDSDRKYAKITEAVNRSELTQYCTRQEAESRYALKSSQISVVTLTQRQYDELRYKDPNTLYAITD